MVNKEVIKTTSHGSVQLALKAGVFYDKVSNVTIWGNHSTTQVIMFHRPEIGLLVYLY